MLIEFSKIITGGQFNDDRGTVSFVNDFDMSSIKRFYAIQHTSVEIVRAWQGHKVENKWFYCVRGSFLINVIQIDNWEQPSMDLIVTSHYLKSRNPSVLYVPGGHVTGIKALEADSSLIVFSNMFVKESKDDDFRFDKNKWFNWNSV
jgi:dTDP-4-dehydrorhamnose 3,5-epimerase-like enzyme